MAWFLTGRGSFVENRRRSDSKAKANVTAGNIRVLWSGRTHSLWRTRSTKRMSRSRGLRWTHFGNTRISRQESLPRLKEVADKVSRDPRYPCQPAVCLHRPLRIHLRASIATTTCKNFRRGCRPSCQQRKGARNAMRCTLGVKTGEWTPMSATLLGTD